MNKDREPTATTDESNERLDWVRPEVNRLDASDAEGSTGFGGDGGAFS